MERVTVCDGLTPEWAAPSAMIVRARVHKPVNTKAALSEGERCPKPWLARVARETAGCRLTAGSARGAWRTQA